NQTLTELARALCGSHPRAVAELLGERSGDGPSPDTVRERPGGAEARPLPRTTPTPQRETALQPVLPPGQCGAASGQEGGDIAVAGPAGRRLQAASVEDCWDDIRGGGDGVTEIPADRWDHATYYDPEPVRRDRTYAKCGAFTHVADHFDPL